MEAAMRTLFRKKYIEGVADRCFPEFEIRGRRVNEYLLQKTREEEDEEGDPNEDHG